MQPNFLKEHELKFSLLNGFFPEDIPKELFSTKRIFKFLNNDVVADVEKHLSSSSIKATSCFLYSIYKEETERRILSIPHITTYLCLSNFILENINFIYDKIANNSISNSKNIFLPYSLTESFEEILKKRVWNSIGNKYILSIDISKCYENIYTHSISWGLIGKKEAKIQYSKKESEQSEEYKKANKLDEKIRRINNNETKGIPTGPITSRLISELVLAEIDNTLKETMPSLKYNRFVDDYKFYFLKKEDALQFIPVFQRILHDFKLSINQNKTKIDLFPNGIFGENLNLKLNKFDFTKNNISTFINTFMFMHNSGVKGAFKYGMKVLSSQEIEEEDKDYVLSYLINSLMIFPKISNIIINIFDKNNLITKSNKEQIGLLLNNLLAENIKNHHDEEIFWNLNFLIKFDIDIDLKYIPQILKREEIFSTIIILDYIFTKKISKNQDIECQLKCLKNQLKNENIYSDKWLLIYECTFNDWISGLKQILNKDKLLKLLFDNKINFYNSPFREYPI